MGICCYNTAANPVTRQQLFCAFLCQAYDFSLPTIHSPNTTYHLWLLQTIRFEDLTLLLEPTPHHSSFSGILRISLCLYVFQTALNLKCPTSPNTTGLRFPSTKTRLPCMQACVAFGDCARYMWEKIFNLNCLETCLMRFLLPGVLLSFTVSLWSLHSFKTFLSFNTIFGNIINLQFLFVLLKRPKLPSLKLPSLF